MITALVAYLDRTSRGPQNATPLPTVAAELGVTTRQVQEALEECAGIVGEDVICSRTAKPAGLYITRVQSEVAPFHHQLEHREGANRRRKQAIERRFPGLRTVTKRTPPLRIEQSGRPEQQQLELVS